MSDVLIQTSGGLIAEEADPKYQRHTQGPRFCDEPLRHGTYFNASPYWRREGFGRRAAWESVEAGNRAVLYCTGSVDEHGPGLTHVFGIETVEIEPDVGARLDFNDTQELVPTIEPDRIRREVEAERLSEGFEHCGQQGFNITAIEPGDIDRLTEIANLFDPL